MVLILYFLLLHQTGGGGGARATGNLEIMVALVVAQELHGGGTAGTRNC
jgi:hypothetical protein